MDSHGCGRHYTEIDEILHKPGSIAFEADSAIEPPRRSGPRY
jgi:hypothetical protein